MSTVAAKKATSIRLNRELYNYIEELAKRENRSLNNLIETVLSRATGFDSPNKETLEAMEEVEKHGDSLKCYSNAKSLFEDIEK